MFRILRLLNYYKDKKEKGIILKKMYINLVFGDV